jgi:hypothetical protein
VVIAYMSGTNNIDNGVRIVDVTGAMTAGGFQLSLRCQPEPVFIQALHTDR